MVVVIVDVVVGYKSSIRFNRSTAFVERIDSQEQMIEKRRSINKEVLISRFLF